AAPGQVRTPGAATLDASTSSDPEAAWGGGIRSYHFDFGDGSGADSATPVVTHAYARPGVYAATVTVTDVQGLAGSPSEPAQVRPLRAEGLRRRRRRQRLGSRPRALHAQVAFRAVELEPDEYRARARERWGGAAAGWERRREAMQASAAVVSRWLVDHVDPQP